MSDLLVDSRSEVEGARQAPAAVGPEVTDGRDGIARRVLVTARAGNWWHSKLPPLFTVAYATMLLHDSGISLALGHLAASMVALCSVAWYAHVVNDLFDIEDDARSGKANRLATFGRGMGFTLAVVLGLAGTGLTVWRFHANSLPLGLLLLNYLVFTLYSVPPVRLKMRTWWGVAADAVGAHLIPSLFVMAAMRSGAPVTASSVLLAASVFVWSSCAGLRNILVHQYADREGDRRAGVRTVGDTLGVDQLRWLVLRVIVSAEAVALVAFVSVLIPAAPVIVVVVPVFALLELLKMRLGWTMQLFPDGRGTPEPYRPLVNNGAYELWLPLVLAFSLALTDWRYAPLPLLHVALFLPGISPRVRDLARLAHDARLKMVGARLTRLFLAADRLLGRVRPGPARPRVIATACWHFPIYSQTFVYEELEQLSRNGFNVRILYTELAKRAELGGRFDRLWRRRRRTWLHSDVATKDMAWFRRRMPQRVAALTETLSRASGLTPEQLAANDHFRLGFSFARMAAAYRPDYLHSYFFYEGTLFTFMASRLLGVPRGVSCYADHRLNDYTLKMVGQQLRACEVVVATSRTIGKELERAAAWPDAPNILVKPNAINTAQFPFVERAGPATGAALRLVCVSRFDPKKGLEYLIEAVRILLNQGMAVRLHVVGEADHVPASLAYREHLTARVAEFGLGDTVVFEGRRSQAEILDLLTASHVFVAPFVELDSGDSDGIPTALMEAMSTGAPIVTTDSGSISEVIEHDRTGLMVPQRNAAAIADAVARLALDPDLRARLGSAAARVTRERFDVEVCERHFHERVRNVIGAAIAGVERHMTGRAERVIVGSSFWAVNGVNTFAASLTRALADAGTDASLLLTEANTRRVTITDPVMPLPAGVVHRVLPVRPWENWGAAWGSLVAELRGRAPCVWMPNADFRHSVVSPRLPDEVLIVGVVHGNDPLHFDHVERLGRYWNAVVAVNDGLGREVAHRHPELADRVVTIPPGVEVPALPRAPRLHRDGALRLLYVGSLVQHPKRILDFPPLIEHCLTIGLPVRLTVVGGGSDEPALRSASRTLIEQGSITLAGVVSPNRVPALLQEHDALLLMSDFEGTPNAVLEAMAQGCIPVVSATANDAGLVRDGWNGFVFPTGDIVAAAGALKRLLDAGPAGASQLADRGHATVRDGYSIESVAARYLDLFTALRRDVERGAFRRPSSELAPPPRRVGPDVIFPLEAPHHVPGVGRFPSADDAEDYEEHLTPPTDRARVKVTAPVVVSVQGWAWSGIHRRVHRMVRGLRLRGVDARILVTEAGAPCHPPVPLPDDVPVDTLPVLPDDSWGARWGATVRYFEDLAPQAWLPVTDWGHACIVPRVADRVRVIGMAWDDDPTCLEYLRWLAPYLNSVISMSRNARRMLRNTDQSFAAPIAVIPDGIDVGASLPLRSPDPDNRLRCLVLNPVEAIESTLSNIAAQLQTAGIDARYTIVGSSQRAETVLTTSVDYVTTPVPDSVLLDTDVVIVEGNGEWLPDPALGGCGCWRSGDTRGSTAGRTDANPRRGALCSRGTMAGRYPGRGTRQSGPR